MNSCIAFWKTIQADKDKGFVMYDLIVIGAGAAGLCAAIRAKKNNKACNILIIEKQTKCGRKLSASGNGRCNVTNDSWNDKCFVSSDEAFIQSFVKRHSPDEVKDFFEDCGILLSDNNGYYYPISNQAKQVTEKLLRLGQFLFVRVMIWLMLLLKRKQIQS